MTNLFLLEIGMIGFLAQIIDGALGMGYGVTSATLLISLGIYPAIVSASVHTSEIFTTLVSGASHFKFGNIRKDLLKPLISFGIAGGVIGASSLVKLPSRPIKLFVGLILLAMGGIILYRFMFKHKQIVNPEIRKYPINRLRILGFFAAFIDAMAGGGWGPICTPTLVITGTEPNKAVGSVNFAEFFITLAITSTFLVLIGPENFRWDVVLMLIIGGVIAAPIAAFICKKLPKCLLGILVGIIVVILNLVRLLKR